MNFLRFAFLTLLLVASCNTTEKSSEPASQTEALLATADKLNKAVMARDYTTFAGYTHPAIVESTGGKEKFMELMSRGSNRMEGAGVSFISMTNGKPGPMIKQNGELQTTLPQTVELKTRDGRVKTKTTLIAISKDNGKTWHFIDTFQTDPNSLRTLIPTLSKDLVIPPPQQPEIIKD